MILPATSLASILLLILTVVCWGSWANTQKLVYKWRFELFYYDFAVGVAICALIAVYTVGSANPQELTVSDNMLIAGYRKIAYGLVAGLVVNLATILLVAAISLCGMTVAFPIVFGTGLIVMSVLDFIGQPGSFNSPLLFSGLVLLLGAVLAEIFAYRGHLDALSAKSKSGPLLDPGTRLPIRPPKAAVGITLSAISGLTWGFVFPLMETSRTGDNGVGPYGLAGLMAVGLVFSTLLYVPFFINFPVQGEPVQARAYFQGTKKQHFWGIFGGIIWTVGLVAALVEQAGPPPVRASIGVTKMLVFGAPILAFMWGFLAWREFKGSPQSVNLLQFAMFFLFLTGLTLLSIASAFATK